MHRNRSRSWVIIPDELLQVEVTIRDACHRRFKSVRYSTMWPVWRHLVSLEVIQTFIPLWPCLKVDRALDKWVDWSLKRGLSSEHNNWAVGRKTHVLFIGLVADLLLPFVTIFPIVQLHQLLPTFFMFSTGFCIKSYIAELLINLLLSRINHFKFNFAVPSWLGKRQVWFMMGEGAVLNVIVILGAWNNLKRSGSSNIIVFAVSILWRTFSN